MLKAPIFVWDVTKDYTHGRIAIDDTLGAMSVVLFKAHDGLEYQTYSPEDMAAWADGVYRPQGIDLYPWGVARGWDLDVAREEGRLAGRHAVATDREYILDLEPYPDYYWQGITGTPRAFCEGYAETSGGRMLRLCPDARNPGINIEEWAAEPVVNIWQPQIYATAYGESVERWLDTGVKPILDLGVSKSRIYPVLAGWYTTESEPSISPDDLERDILTLAREGYPGFSIWRRGSISQLVVERLLAMADPFAPVPPSPPPPLDIAKVRIEPVGEPTYHWTDQPDIREQRQLVRLVIDP